MKPVRAGKFMSGVCGRWVLTLAICGGTRFGADPASAADDAPLEVPLSERRVVKQFDFFEPNNHEPIPMFWLKHRGAGFPNYAEGKFDAEVGHDAGPSFYLSANGANVAYYYYSRDVPIKHGSDYLVRGWIRADRLRVARACIGAYYMDRLGQKVRDSERTSVLVGGTGAAVGEWAPIEVFLPAPEGPERMIGIACYVLQPALWDTAPAPPREIEEIDIAAGAWFDDISVTRLPRLRLSAASASAVFGAEETPLLVAEVHDPDGFGLRAELRILAADGSEVARRDLEIRQAAPGAERQSVSLPDLPPGWYRAALDIRSAAFDMPSRSIAFVRLGPALDAGAPGAEAMNPAPRARAPSGFGLALPDYDSSAWPVVAQLAAQLGNLDVKMPLWSVRSDPSLAADAPIEFMGDVQLRGGRTIGVLADVPGDLQRPERVRPLDLMDLFQEESAHWLSRLRDALARYASVVSYWQVGADGDEALIWDARLPRTVAALRPRFEEMVAEPLMTASWSVQQQTVDGSLPAAGVSLFVSSAIAPDRLAAHFEAFRGSPYAERWLALETLARGRYPREQALADYARRLIAARAVGADVAFVPPPWTVRAEAGRVVAEPDETFLILRTLNAALGGAKHVRELTLQGDARGQLFSRGGAGVMVLWNDLAPGGGEELELQLGGTPRCYDVWGVEHKLPQRDGRYVLTLGPLPLILRDFDSQWMLLRTALALIPPRLDSSAVEHDVQLEIANPYPYQISGQVRIIAPPRWIVTPSRIDYSLARDETQRYRLSVRFPLSEYAGEKEITARVTLDSNRELLLDVPLPLELASREISVTAMAQVVGERLVIRQSVTSFADRALSFDGFVVIPDRPRQSRLIPNIQPGQTVIREYAIDGARALSGRSLRVGLREVDGSIMHNAIVRVP